MLGSMGKKRLKEIPLSRFTKTSGYGIEALSGSGTNIARSKASAPVKGVSEGRLVDAVKARGPSKGRANPVKLT